MRAGLATRRGISEGACPTGQPITHLSPEVEEEFVEASLRNRLREADGQREKAEAVIEGDCRVLVAQEETDGDTKCCVHDKPGRDRLGDIIMVCCLVGDLLRKTHTCTQ